MTRERGGESQSILHAENEKHSLLLCLVIKETANPN